MAYTKEDLEKRLAQMIAERGGKSDQIINSSTLLGQVLAAQKAQRARAEAVDAEAPINGRSGGDPKPSQPSKPKVAAKKAPAKKTPSKKAPEKKAPEKKAPEKKAEGKTYVVKASGKANGGAKGASGNAKPRMKAAHPVYDAISKNGNDSPKTGLKKPLLQIVFGGKGNRTKAEAAEAASKKRIRGQ